MNAGGRTRAWRIAAVDYRRTTALSQALGVPQIIAHLLLSRGVETPEQGERFLQPSADHLSDPFSLRDMDRAVERIRQARDRNEHVMVFGDYDVDGITGTAILVRALQRFGIQEVSYGLPERVLEGYGLGPQHVREAHERGAGLLVTVDNGISSHEAAEEARRLGVDLVITDHHTLPETLPPAVAVVNPKREDPSHPAANASGALIALKLASALTGELQDLDLAAVGLVADIVPLRGENRDVVALGLRQFVERPNMGLLRLARVAGLDPATVTSEDVAFQIAPRINAIGRLHNAMTGIQLLLTESPPEAQELAGQLDAANQERKALENKILEQAIEELERTHDADSRSIVLAGKGWHPGVIGIVASRIKSRYGRPVVLLSVNGEGLGRGSARTVEGFDLMTALRECRQHLVAYGGHYTAAGLTISAEAIEAFRRAFENEAVKRLPDGGVTETLEIDSVVSLSQIDVRFVKMLDCLQPFGCGNPAPLFASCGVTPLENSLRELNGGHLRFTVQAGPRVSTAIAFGMGSRFSELEALEACDIAFTPQLRTFRGQTGIQLVVKDIRPCPEDDDLDSL